MSVRARLARIWKYPVGSNLIAALVSAAAGSLLATQLPSALLEAYPSARIATPVVLVLVLLLLINWPAPRSRTLVFLSRGGTGRDPMAKAILIELLKSVRPRRSITVVAAGLGPVEAQEAEFAARFVIREMFGKDLLGDHKPLLFTTELAARADLILVMDDSLLGNGEQKGVRLPRAKTYLLKEFFGLAGNIDDPYPDGKDEITLNRYRSCANELRDILRTGLDRLTGVLDV